ncbi:MAG: hypothetical protein FWG47_05235 [Propionibacteriaceae bacterium]|nr:hypothetical protein [Propionibacteriaceae bacterium]
MPTESAVPTSSLGTVSSEVVDTVPDFPFAAYVGVVRAYTTEITDNSKVSSELQEPHVAQCMKERGFTYSPQFFEDESSDWDMFPNGAVLHLPTLLNAREEVVKTGYGMFTAPELSLQTEAETENSNYRKSLSPAARDQYDLALLGYLSPYDPPDPNIPESCRQKAMREHPSPPVEETNKDLYWQQYGQLALAMDELVSWRVSEDLRVAVLNAEWNACMSKQSYDLTSGNLYSRSNVSPWAAYTRALRTKANGQLGESWFNYQFEQTTPLDERSLLGTPQELEIAVADFDCREETDYLNRFAQVQIELERTFVEKNKKQLDAMLAFAEQYPADR